MNVFTYDKQTERGYCGDPDRWQSWVFITPLSETEVKEKMRAFAESLPRGTEYCHGNFLNSIAEHGVLMESYNDLIDADITGGLLDNEICLDGIEEKDIFSSEKYSELIAAREEAARKEREKKAEEARKRKEEVDRRKTDADIKRLKELGYSVTR